MKIKISKGRRNMKKISLLLLLLLSFVVPVLNAATCVVDGNATYQYIRGIGASSAWYGLAGASATALFGDNNLNGNIGISMLRARIDPNGNHTAEINNLVAAKAAYSNLLCWAAEWSPPAQYKANNNVNGPATNNTFLGASSGTPNSADTGYASYLVSYIQYAKSRGIDLYAISPQNEPNWNPDYEACLWTAGQFEVFARAFKSALNAAGLTTKIMIPEPINPGGMNLAATAMNNATTASYISILGTHLYGGMPNPLNTYGFTQLTNQEFWETEISANTTDIAGALQQAGWVQTCLVNASMNAFHYWWIQDLATNGQLNIKAFALGSYSKFIRPGYYRMGATAAPTSGVQVSAFKNTNNSSPSKIVFVAINNNSSATSQTFTLNGLNVTSVTPWRTDASTNLVAQSAVSVSGGSFTYSLPARSIVSFVGTNNGTGPTSTNTPIVPTVTSTPCVSTAIVAYLQVGTGAWTQTNSATVASLPATVNLGPQPATGGTWSWTGPNGFTSTSRELLGIALSAGTNVYTATYTNACGAKSTQAFTITVQSTSTSTATPVVTPVNTPITSLFGGNPLMYQKYTADPTAAWFNNRMYIYTSHDKNGATGYDITDVTLMSSDDLVNWTDEGEAVKASNTSWAGLTYAPDAVYRNGYYYVYFGNGGGSIGVVRSTSPTGPFTDPVGRAIVTGSTPGCSGMTYVFDPAVFIDDDGQAYMYFGGGGPGNARVIRMNSDMISVNGSAVTIDAPRYFEAPFMNKRNGIYYFSYCTDFSASPSAAIDYMTSSNPMTGFTRRGTILDNPSDNCGNNSHASIVNIGDNWYLAYHTRKLSNTNLGNCNGIYQRSASLDRLYFNADGTIQKVIATTTGVNALKTVNPYTTNKAVTMAKETGITTETCSEGGLNVASIENNDWILVKNLDFGTGATSFNARVASATSGGNIQIRLDSVTGTIIGTCAVTGTGGWQTWQTKTCAITGATGRHDVYFVFTGGTGTLFNFEWYNFTQTSVTPTFTVTNTPITPSPTPVTKSTWRVLAGSTSAYTDSQGNIWSSDSNYNSGTAYSTTTTVSNALPAASDMALYQTERYGNPFTYSFNVPAGSYQVSLKFAETYFTAAGQRIFNLSINGTQVLTNFDIYASAGAAGKALDRVFNNIAPSNGVITIQFGTASVDNAKVDAIQIIPQPVITPTATPTTPVPTNTPITPSPTPTTPVPTNTPITPSPTPTTPVPTDTPITPVSTDTPITESPTPTTPVPTDTPITPSPTPTTPVPTDTPITPSPTPTTPVPTNTPITPSPTPTTPVPTNTPITPSPTPTIPMSTSLNFMLKSSDIANNISSPHPQIRVINNGTSAANLNNIEVRYWINCDCTGQAVQAFVDWSGKMPQGTSLGSNVQVSAVSVARGTQTGYISIKFSGNITLLPNEYVEVQARFNKSDWSAMTQSNDWSFSNSQSWLTYNKLTGYSSGSLIWGQEPPVTTSTVQVGNVITYPNPATSASGATLSYTINPVSSGISAASANDTIYVPDASTRVYLKIFTHSGRLIWSKVLEGVYYVSSGEHSVKWDGKAPGGHELSAGTYTLSVVLKETNGSSTAYSTIIMLK
jgi:arabinoxylan arabinofuranohydrolase